MANKKIDYLGVDNSETLIAIARQNYPLKRFLVADVLRLDEIKGEGFDHIFCLAVLPHIPSSGIKIEGACAVEKQTGAGRTAGFERLESLGAARFRRLLLKVWGLKILGRSELDFNDLIFPWKDSSGRVVSQRYYHAFTKKGWKNLARAAGWRTVKIWRNYYNFWLILKNK